MRRKATFTRDVVFRATFSIAIRVVRDCDWMMNVCVYVWLVKLRLLMSYWYTYDKTHAPRKSTKRVKLTLTLYQPKYNLHMVDYITHVVGICWNMIEWIHEKKTLRLIYSSEFRLAFSRWCRLFGLQIMFASCLSFLEVSAVNKFARYLSSFLNISDALTTVDGISLFKLLHFYIFAKLFRFYLFLFFPFRLD